MIHINEWDPVPWDTPRPAKGLPSRPPARTALVDLISGKLKTGDEPPMAVHFYLGEGLKWIRVGFDAETSLAPPAVGTVGRAIAECVGDAGPLSFSALRSQDMLFFLEGGREKSTGMGPRAYGRPLEEVLEAWGLAPAPALKASPKRRTRSATG